jgi:23S rRNA pseudouridine955/2504/2580 synthase
MFLHAHAVRLAHPVTGAPLALEALLPAACEDLLQALGERHAAAV